MMPGTGAAAALGNGSYLGELASSTWGNPIQATQQIAAQDLSVNNAS